MTNSSTKSIRPFGFQQRHRQRNSRLWVVTLIAVLIAVSYSIYWWQFDNYFVITNDAYVSGNLTPLKAQTSGTVVDVRVEETQYVNQGDVLVRLDGLESQVVLASAEASLAVSIRQVETLFKQVDMLQQKLKAKKAIVHRSQHDLLRYRSVASEGAVSAQQIENTEFMLNEQEAELQQIQAELGGAEALTKNTNSADNPKVLQAIAAFKQAYLDHARQLIVSPVSGFIAKRSIQLGEQVRPEATLMEIVPLDYLWIEANFLENELAKVQPGQSVEITVDLYGTQHVYHGKVQGLAAGTGSVFGLLPPDNATGNYIHIVERVPVRISILAEELKAHPLRPGLSATVRIDIKDQGRSVLLPLTTIPASGYKTDVYDHQLDGADQLIKKIIKQNISERS